MAGTRLFIQSLALVELIALAALSFYFGLCRKNDVLCSAGFWASTEDQSLHPLPLLDAPTSLPLIQVDKQLHWDTTLAWKKNPNTVIVCSQPESPVVRGQTVWWCPPVSPEDPPRIVVRNSSMIIFSKEWQLPELVMPQVSEPFPLSVYIVLEKDDDTASKAQRLAASLEETIAQLKYWPCVKNVEVHMTVVEPYSSKWFVPEQSTSEETSEATQYNLPKVNEAQAEEILEKISLPSRLDGKVIVLYVPRAVPEENSSFHVEQDQFPLFMVGGWDATAVQQFLMNKVGIPSSGLDTDGTFPIWYEEWYWFSAMQQIAGTIMRDYTRSQRLLAEPLSLEQSDFFKEHYEALIGLHSKLEAVFVQKELRAEFPLEHYAAIFAPLLFPLLLPFLASTIKEFKRYKRKKRKEKTKEKEKED